MQFYKCMTSQFPGSVVLLDWSGGGPIAHDETAAVQRVRRAPPWDVQTLAAALEACDLLVGIDSGPAHLARLVDARTLFVTFPLLPARHVALPHDRTRWLVPQDHADAWQHRGKEGWGTATYQGRRPSAKEAADQALLMLGHDSEPVEATKPEDFRSLLKKTADGVHWIKDSGRYATFAAFFNCLETMKRPSIVETGCIRSLEDWSAGYSTYLFARYLLSTQMGTLDVVDITPERLEFARTTCAFAGARIRFHLSDSVAWLRDATGPFDAVYLDSMDADLPGHAEHCLAEAQVIEPKVRSGGVILIDDTPQNDPDHSKGRFAALWLESLGWKVLARGYQVLLEKP
jgi:hypothetical protein